MVGRTIVFKCDLLLTMKVELILKLVVAGAAIAGVASGCVTSHKKEYITHESWTYSSTGAVIGHDVWSENHHGGGVAVFADPAAAQITSYHTNQSGLGGSSSFSVGTIQAHVSSNTAPIINATGSAVSNAIGGLLLK
jgi:hypothetical protein